ncbi:hypothetical protein RDABS01_035841 [Bienertia sinuspersici]
MLLIYQSNQLL